MGKRRLVRLSTASFSASCGTGAMRAPAEGERRGGVAAVAALCRLGGRFFLLPLGAASPAVCRARRGLCCVCLEGLEEAKELDAFWMELCGSLGVPFNLLKRQQCGQSVECAILEE